MHPVLLIDEVLELILELCSSWSEKDYRRTLSQVARCCRAWQDPALDRLWCRLDGIMPLVRLLPGCVVRNNEVVFEEVADLYQDAFARFNWYAPRVKNITQTVESVSIPSSLYPFVTLPNLRKVHLAYAGCATASCWGVSEAMRDVNLNVGYAEDPDFFIDKKPAPSIQSRRIAMNALLEELNARNTPLQRLRVRGSVNDSITRSMLLFTTLSVLEVHVGRWLSVDKFATIATTFPSLCQLDVDAHHLNADAFARELAPSVTQIFPSLQVLRITAKTALMLALIPLLPVNMLQSLHLDPDCPDGPSSLIPVFDCLATQVPGSLQELTIEYYPDYDEWDDIIAYPNWFSIDVLRPLARLANVRRFRVTATKLPQLGDEDMEEMSTWWRHLEDLDLGTLDDPNDKGRGMTPAAYVSLAMGCPMLKNLKIPVDIPDLAETSMATPVAPVLDAGARQPTSHIGHGLQSLRVGALPGAPEAVSAFFLFIAMLFPSLIKIELPPGSGPLQLGRSPPRPAALLHYINVILACR